MRIFVIGLGGAGCRIADMLYGQDRRFSAPACVEAIAVDGDADALNRLSRIPIEKRIYFPHVSVNTDDITTDITIDEIVTLLHNLDTGDKDAILVVTGAGGTMSGLSVPIIERIRTTVVEPVFGLVTLPRVEEGREISANAAEDIDRLMPLLEGVILFDNEKLGTPLGPPRTTPIKKSFVPNPLKKQSPREPEDPGSLMRGINSGIARSIGLLLRAGETVHGGEIETGEVVLDAGEILNTIRGMGFIAIGIASADTSPPGEFHIPQIVRPTARHVETGHSKAERLIDIAKSAVYEKISVPCDLTSAQKALILVAGPAHEISMKGFMTVRKWIDRSIAGTELRSGDYPVKSTHHLAVIVILAGLSGIQRIEQIRSIRDEYSHENPGWRADTREKARKHAGISKYGNVQGKNYPVTPAPGARTTSILARIPGFPRTKPGSAGEKPGDSCEAPKPGTKQETTPEPVPAILDIKPVQSGPESHVADHPVPGYKADTGFDPATRVPGATRSIAAEKNTVPEGSRTATSPSGSTGVVTPMQGQGDVARPDLASVVARAREDLKKTDTTQEKSDL